MAGGGSGRKPDAELFAQHARSLFPSGVDPDCRKINRAQTCVNHKG